MTRDSNTDDFARAIKAASDEELADFVRELFPDSLLDDGLSDLPDGFFAAMRDTVELIDKVEEGEDVVGGPNLDSAQAELLGVDLTATNPLYMITARHTRLTPADRQTDWNGSVSAVSVQLGAEDSDWKDRRTQIGWVNQRDHLVHSRAGLARAYAEHFNVAPPRIDSLALISGARLLGFPRFAPISLLLASSGGELKFYAVESADVMGRPKQLFIAPAMGESMSGAAGYSYTFMARRDNQYHGTLAMDADNAHPQRFGLEVYLGSEPRPKPHLRLEIDFARVDKAEYVTWGHFWVAVRRASAIGYPMGYHPKQRVLKAGLATLAAAGRRQLRWHKSPVDSRRAPCDGPYVNCHSTPTQVAAPNDATE